MLRRRLALALLVAVLGVAATAQTATAAAKTACWRRVIEDWSKDGVINGHYSAKCLRQAIKKTPEDLRDYSSIVDDINAALIDSTGAAGGRNGGNPKIPGAQPGTSRKSLRVAKKFVPAAGTPASEPGHDRSFPLPLIILGAIILAGAIAAASPYGIRRLRTRFPRLRPTPGSVRPPA